MRKHLWKIPHIYQLMFNIFDIEYTIRMNTLSSLKLNKHIVIVQVESINHFIAFKHAFLNQIIEQNFFTSLCTKFNDALLKIFLIQDKKSHYVKKENNDIVLLFAIVFLLESNYETNL